MKKREIITIMLLLLVLGAFAQEHPRGMVSSAELRTMKHKATQNPYRQQVADLEKHKVSLLAAKVFIGSPKDSYEAEKNLHRLAMLYAFTSNKDYAQKAANWARMILADTVVWNNPLVKGLTRAALLKAVATAYDLCFDAWPAPLQQEVSIQLFETARSLHSLMGTEANFALESNWMGVRYAAVLYALAITDHTGRKNAKNSEQQLMLWDAGERLRDHIKANMNPNGWSGESLGYHYYSWSFIGPALMAYEHRSLGRGKALATLAPYCANVIATHATVLAYIQGNSAFRGLKPDFSDDNLGVRPEFFLQAFRLYPTAQHAPLRWLVDAMEAPLTEENLFYKLAWYPDSILPQNPGDVGWLNTVEEEQGAIAFRNRFQDSTDVVAAFTTTAKRIRAHQSGDNLSFRLLGLDNIWVVGGGRTGLMAGQPTVFPTDAVSLTESYTGGAIGQLVHHGFYPGGGGFALGKGSCMGVEDHQRFFAVSYDSATIGATAALVVHDRSTNGKTWRLTTPEWNQVQVLSDGFLITAPNGATLRATVLAQKRPLHVKTSVVKYNGTTTENASGIPFKGRVYPNITAVDVSMEGETMVVMTLQPADRKHPAVQLMADGSVQAGNKQFDKIVWE